ncbi:predicted protein [Uncinocarpus reesii 1704]|uniref:HDA1 complex subunit n=1 Tax=Uncinocarpus reesii (strain UAMH 1704) TaxID=336963 RepID=C4JM31_UNCRE|nr:uncharacterized protein UREG_03889 [Uncinocarpus reesii 1704]EEP79043.1 predicted protein [Uncinocarpus reesii 1704]
MEGSASNDSQRPQSVAEAARNNPGTTFLERMTYLRAAERASIKPLQSLTESETPSSAGDIEPSAPPTAAEGVIPLSVRHDKAPPARLGHETASPVPFVAPQALHYNPDQPALLGEAGVKLGTTNLSTPTASLELAAQQLDHGASFEKRVMEEHKGVSLGSFEFAIPLSMDSRVKDDYDNTLEEMSKNIRKFVAGSASSTGAEIEDSLAPQMRRMIERLDNISTHPDLNLPDQPSSGSLEVEKEASWAEYSSSKFQFLGYFIDAVSEASLARPIHVIVMAKPGTTIDILTKYFLGKQLEKNPSEVPGKQQSVFTSGHLSFELRMAGGDPTATPFKEPSIIIALDSSFNASDPTVIQLRTTSSPDRLVPVVRLIISNTAEHIALCLPEFSDLDKLRLLVKYTNFYSSVAGEVQDDALGVQENAEETLRYLLSDPDAREWTLPDVEVVGIPISEQSSLEPEQLRTMSASRQKRWLGQDDGEEVDIENSSKRQRMTPFQDITHISDSMKGQTQGTQEASPLKSQGKSDTAENAETRELRATLEDLQNRLQAVEANFANLQHRYESKHELYHKIRRELNQTAESAKRSAARVEKQKEEISRLRDEKSALIKDLEEARQTIREGGGLPADLENAKEEIRKLSEENSRLERVSQQERSQSEFTRQQYQNASSAAAQSGIEVRQLGEQVEELKRKSSGEASRLKELRTQSTEKEHLARVQELEKLLASREKLLMMKEEEVKDLRKNRPATRSTSTQPRSPKFAGMSRPASPAPNSSTGSNNLGRGSVLRFRVEP